MGIPCRVSIIDKFLIFLSFPQGSVKSLTLILDLDLQHQANVWNTKVLHKCVKRRSEGIKAMIGKSSHHLVINFLVLTFLNVLKEIPRCRLILLSFAYFCFKKGALK